MIERFSNAIGIEIYGGKIDKIIKENSKLPIVATKRYKTVCDFQGEAIVDIYELKGDRNNIKIGTINISEIPKKESGEQYLDIGLKCDFDGILSTIVKIVDTEKVKRNDFKCNIIEVYKPEIEKNNSGQDIGSNGNQDMDNNESEMTYKVKSVEDILNSNLEDNIDSIDENQIVESIDNNVSDTILNEEESIRNNIIETTEIVKNSEKEDNYKVEDRQEVKGNYKVENKQEVKDNNTVKDTVSINENKGGENNKKAVSEIKSKEDTNNELEQNINTPNDEEVKNSIDKVSEEVEDTNSQIIENESLNKDSDEAQVKESSEEDEEEDYSSIYTEVSYLSKYVNANIEDYDMEGQKVIRAELQDLLINVRAERFKECREIEHKILKLMGVE